MLANLSLPDLQAATGHASRSARVTQCTRHAVHTSCSAPRSHLELDIVALLGIGNTAILAWNVQMLLDHLAPALGAQLRGQELAALALEVVVCLVDNGAV